MTDKNKEFLIKKIDRLKREMNEEIYKSTLNSSKVLKMSQKIDKLIYKVMKKQDI